MPTRGTRLARPLPRTVGLIPARGHQLGSSQVRMHMTGRYLLPANDRTRTQRPPSRTARLESLDQLPSEGAHIRPRGRARGMGTKEDVRFGIEPSYERVPAGDARCLHERAVRMCSCGSLPTGDLAQPLTGRSLREVRGGPDCTSSRPTAHAPPTSLQWPHLGK